MNNWLTLITSLPTENATARMRAWRALKASGAAVLRDGVYLLPSLDSCQTTLSAIAADVMSSGGSAHLLHVAEPNGADFPTLFDRGDDYSALLADIGRARDALSADTALDTLKLLRKLRKAFANLADIDFFPGEAQKQANAALEELEVAANRSLAPDEPHPIERAIPSLAIGDYQGRTWATRHRPWVDRLACAWLIRRFIDPQARLLWLQRPTDCPADALGFDFDGAHFSHVGGRVTFEVLLASFRLDQPSLGRIGALVHYLDVGGIQPPEAAGIEQVLAGLRQTLTDDDQLLAAASHIFEGLLTAFEPEAGAHGNSGT
ncbi:chromate resistance protein [Pandoraea terrae]|uniref:Chromate resistance protein n=1 Tax=Pandoraea terrae TaxID=1537710 RepID=A0A5E4V248_9BURK|nr:chromate resistance protein ChrB domain-containing protein [Pandoraea terrae]VVE06307.1 chromate resistance protein [Pandoraea terrae]